MTSRGMQSCAVLLFWLAGPAAAEDYPAVDCIIQPSQVVDLGSPVAGVIHEVLVDRSDYVRRGQPVARIQDRIEVATVELARARAKVDAQLESERINLAYDKKSQRRIDSLYNRKVIAIDNKDDADRDAELSVLRIEQVKDLQTVRNEELERAMELVEQKIIRSPIDGFVVNRYKSQGEFVEDQPILRIAQLDPLNIEAIIPMKYFGMIQLGMLAEVYPEVVASKLHEARVTVVDRVGDAASGTFGVRLEMENPDFKIPAGLKCEVKFLHTSERILAEARQKIPPPWEAKPEHPEQKIIAEQPQTEELTPLDPPILEPALVAEPIIDYSLGPFTDEQTFLEARDMLQDLDLTNRRQVMPVMNYMVVSIEAGDTSLIQEKLVEGNVKDYRQLVEPHNYGRFSLGIYSTRARAGRRVTALEQVDIPAEIIEHPASKMTWWLDVKISEEQAQNNIELLHEQGYSVQLVQTPKIGS